MAVFGLFLLVISLYLSSISDDKRFNSSKQYTDAYNQYTLDSAIHEVKSSITDMRLERLDKAFSKDRDSVNKLYVIETINVIKDGSQVISSADKVKQLKKELKFNTKRANQYDWISKTLFVISVILIISGFSFWYQKHQKYIDAKIKYEGDKIIKLLEEETSKNQS